MKKQTEVQWFTQWDSHLGLLYSKAHLLFIIPFWPLNQNYQAPTVCQGIFSLTTVFQLGIITDEDLSLEKWRHDQGNTSELWEPDLELVLLPPGPQLWQSRDTNPDLSDSETCSQPLWWLRLGNSFTCICFVDTFRNPLFISRLLS